MKALPLLAVTTAVAVAGALLWRRSSAPEPPLPHPTTATPGLIYRATRPQLAAAVQRAAWRRITLPSGWSVEVMLEPATELHKGGALYLPADYATALAVATGAGVSLQTPGVMDAVWAAADSRLKPCILPPTAEMASLQWAQRHSACVAAQHPIGLVANAGKNWVRGLVLRPDQAANHGWYDSAAPNGRLWQDKGRQHNREHVDYSQTVSLMRNARDATGAPRDISTVLKGPEYAMLGGAERESAGDMIA
jgi:hypothetical protein